MAMRSKEWERRFGKASNGINVRIDISGLIDPDMRKMMGVVLPAVVCNCTAGMMGEAPPHAPYCALTLAESK